ncbi:hypothetical protein P6144_19585 [Sphingomonas sp. HITSZ_GF]|uniref:BPSS1187 family protein n=1 Tax=Sphingomonas sp. HITSZ_GF TaxID=3037247 RepID=UPI00240D7A22|nr:hypothetical protein [Sphingomonas sp. HITSZ_GF]MDG2535874.1 hypothetical protein [Sphingomonas sp. HITSZ_GF]
MKRQSLIGLALLATVAVASASGWQKDGGGGAIVTPVTEPVAELLATTLAAAPEASATTASLAATVDAIRHDIAATTVDSTATQKNNAQTGVPNKNLTLVPTSPSARVGRLALFILGTNSSETKEQEIVYAAAKRGYHAITLAYPNYDAVAMLCSGVSDTACTAKVRQEMLTGVDLSTRVAVAPKDALETRLQKLLAYLNTTYPAEGWGTYLSGTAINWSMISAIGHSQGAGHVAYLAKLHTLYRATMLSGVADKTSAGAVAPWLSNTNVTPAASQYGFSHSSDATVTIATAEASWNAIGLASFGALTSTDGVAAPYGGSHKLKTALAPASGANIHLSMADDDKLPRNSDGTPKYEPVWDYMAFP